MSAIAGTSVTNPDERQLGVRIAAAVWALSGALGFLATVEPVRTAETQVALIWALSATAALIAAGLLALPPERVSKRLFAVLPVALALQVGLLSYLCGSGRSDLMLLFVFVGVFSGYFFSARTSAVHLGLIAALVTGIFLAVDGIDSGAVARLGIATLLVGVVSVWALVIILRRNQAERERRLQGAHLARDPETGLLTAAAIDHALAAELSRAVRHARPMSLLYVEVFGPALSEVDDEQGYRIASAVARALQSRIRTEDSAARLERFKFAILAPETNDSGAAALAESFSEQVRQRLRPLGYDQKRFSVAVGWADYQYDEVSKEDLMQQADKSLATAILAAEGISYPGLTDPVSATVTRLHDEP